MAGVIKHANALVSFERGTVMSNGFLQLAASGIELEGDRKAGLAHSFRPQLDFVGLKEYSILLLEIEKGAKQNEPLTRLMDMFQQIKRLHDILKEDPLESDPSRFQE